MNDKLPIIDAAMEKVNWRIVDKLRRTEAAAETGLGRMHGLGAVAAHWPTLKPVTTDSVLVAHGSPLS